MSIGRVPGATGIQPTIVDAKGDLIAATAADSVTRLAVGTVNGQFLKVDSSTATGLAWGSIGNVLQVVSTTYSTATTIASTSFTDTGLSLSITPSSTSSKILVLSDLNLTTKRNSPSTGFNTYAQIVRGSTAVYETHVQEIDGSSTGPRLGGRTNLLYLDSPSTTSATTYKIQVSCGSTSNSQESYAQYLSKPSSLILLEIGA